MSCPWCPCSAVGPPGGASAGGDQAPTCATSADCVVVSRTACGVCGSAQSGDAQAVRVGTTPTFDSSESGCPDCTMENDPPRGCCDCGETAWVAITITGNDAYARAACPAIVPCPQCVGHAPGRAACREGRCVAAPTE